MHNPCKNIHLLSYAAHILGFYQQYCFVSNLLIIPQLQCSIELVAVPGIGSSCSKQQEVYICGPVMLPVCNVMCQGNSMTEHVVVGVY